QGDRAQIVVRAPRGGGAPAVAGAGTCAVPRVGGRGAYPRSGGRVVGRAGRGNRHHILEIGVELGLGPPTLASGPARIGPAGRIGGRGAYPRSVGRVLGRAGRGNRHDILELDLGLGAPPHPVASAPAGTGPAGRIGGRGPY